MTAATDAIWEPQRRLTLDQARRRSAFLRVFRLVAATLSGACLVALLLGIVLNGFGPGAVGQRAIGVEETLTMLNPRFSGRDAGGTKYEITADRAVRQGLDTQKMTLSNPKFTTEGGRTVTAPRGFYDPESRVIELFDKVVFTDPKGRQLTTSYALIDSRLDLIQGGRAIAGASGLGEVRADAYEVRREGSQIIMRGRVRGVINASPDASPSSPNPGSPP